MVGARFVRDVEHGEIVVISQDGIESIKPFPAARARPCVFEYVYFAMPDSVVNGRSVYDVRKRMGSGSPRRAPVDRRRRRAGARLAACPPRSASPRQPASPTRWASSATTTSAAPSSSPTRRSASWRADEAQPQPRGAGGQAGDPGRRLDRARHHLGEDRAHGARRRRQGGAPALASPPISIPDFYGIDMPERDKLLAARIRSRRCARSSASTAWRFLSVDGLYWAMGAGPRDPARPQFTDHYFTGEYPTPLTTASAEVMIPRQLSLLAEAS